jgi:hypothetical protein
MRAGRKRKSGRRHPCGKLIQKPADQNQLASRMPHRASEVIYAEFHAGTVEIKKVIKSYVPLTELHSEKAESPLGRLRLVGALSEEQYLAGREFAKDVMRFRRIIECRGQSQSIAGFAEPAAARPREMDEEEALKGMTKYMLAFAAIGSHAAQRAVKYVVCQEEDLAPEHFKYLQMGLDKLIAHYGLTT